MTSESAVQQIQPGARGASVWHPTLVLLFIVVAYLSCDIVSQWRNSGDKVEIDLILIDLVIAVIAGGFFIFELIKLIISLVRFNPLKVAFHLVALAFLVTMVLLAKHVSLAVQYFNLILFHSRYEPCARSADSYSGADRFRLCGV